MPSPSGCDPAYHRPRRYRNPWGVPFPVARRYGYPLTAPSPTEDLEDRVAALEDRLLPGPDDVIAGMSLLDAHTVPAASLDSLEADWEER